MIIPLKPDYPGTEEDYDRILLSNIALIEELLCAHRALKPVDYQRVIKLSHYRNLLLEFLDSRHRKRINNHIMDSLFLTRNRPPVYSRPNATPSQISPTPLDIMTYKQIANSENFSPKQKFVSILAKYDEAKIRRDMKAGRRANANALPLYLQAIERIFPDGNASPMPSLEEAFEGFCPNLDRDAFTITPLNHLLPLLRK